MGLFLSKLHQPRALIRCDEDAVVRPQTHPCEGISLMQLIHLTIVCNPYLPQSNLEMHDVSLTWPWRFHSLFLPFCSFSSLSRADMCRKFNFTETKCSVRVDIYITLSCYRAFCCIRHRGSGKRTKNFCLCLLSCR